jgi:hypothetical protein
MLTARLKSISEGADEMERHSVYTEAVTLSPLVDVAFVSHISGQYLWKVMQSQTRLQYNELRVLVGPANCQ